MNSNSLQAKTVFVHSYIRVRFSRLEHVCEHYRRRPCR